MLTARFASTAAIHIEPCPPSRHAIQTLRRPIAASTPIVHQGAAGSPSSARSATHTAATPNKRAEIADHASARGASPSLPSSRFAASVTKRQQPRSSSQSREQCVKSQPVARVPTQARQRDQMPPAQPQKTRRSAGTPSGANSATQAATVATATAIQPAALPPERPTRRRPPARPPVAPPPAAGTCRKTRPPVPPASPTAPARAARLPSEPPASHTSATPPVTSAFTWATMIQPAASSPPPPRASRINTTIVATTFASSPAENANPLERSRIACPTSPERNERERHAVRHIPTDAAEPTRRIGPNDRMLIERRRHREREQNRQRRERQEQQHIPAGAEPRFPTAFLRQSQRQPGNPRNFTPKTMEPFQPTVRQY